MSSFLKRHKRLAYFLLSVLALVLLLGSWLGYRSIGPYRFYRADMMKPAPGQSVRPGALEIGVAKRDITPVMGGYDPWVDADNNGKFEPKKGDSYTDKNGNGTFDFVWIAGFGNNRAPSPSATTASRSRWCPWTASASSTTSSSRCGR